MRFIANVCRFLCIVIAFGALGAERVHVTFQSDGRGNVRLLEAGAQPSVRQQPNLVTIGMDADVARAVASAITAELRDDVFNQTCGPETQPRALLFGRTAERQEVTPATVASPIPADATHMTIVIPRASYEAILLALQQGQRQGDLVAVTLPMLAARDAFIGLHIAMFPERVTRMTLRE